MLLKQPIEIGKSSLTSILRQGQGKFSTPTRRYKKIRATVITDGFDRDAIRRLIYQQYEGNKRITLNSLLVKDNIM